MRILTEIFASPLKDDMYLYVNRQRGLGVVPKELLERFGKPRSAMTLLLTPDRQLARVQAVDVCRALETQGYYLQLPPPRDEYLLDLYRTPTEARY